MMTSNRRRLPVALLAAVFALALSACGSGPGGVGFSSTCDPGTQIELASPLPNQSGVSTTIGQISIVAYGNANLLYQTYGSWHLTLTGAFGGPLTSSALSLVPFPSGPHPFPSDFYYSGAVPTLSGGDSYAVYLGLVDGSCTPVFVGSFST